MDFQEHDRLLFDAIDHHFISMCTNWLELLWEVVNIFHVCNKYLLHQIMYNNIMYNTRAKKWKYKIIKIFHINIYSSADRTHNQSRLQRHDWPLLTNIVRRNRINNAFYNKIIWSHVC